MWQLRICFDTAVKTLTSAIPLDWGMTTRRSVFWEAGTPVLTGGGSGGGGGDLGGMIFPRLLPPGEPTKPLTEDRGVECWWHLQRELRNTSFPTDWQKLANWDDGACIYALTLIFLFLSLSVLWYKAQYTWMERRCTWRLEIRVKGRATGLERRKYSYILYKR